MGVTGCPARRDSWNIVGPSGGDIVRALPEISSYNAHHYGNPGIIGVEAGGTLRPRNSAIR